MLFSGVSIIPMIKSAFLFNFSSSVTICPIASCAANCFGWRPIRRGGRVCFINYDTLNKKRKRRRPRTEARRNSNHEPHEQRKKKSTEDTERKMLEMVSYHPFYSSPAITICPVLFNCLIVSAIFFFEEIISSSGI